MYIWVVYRNSDTTEGRGPMLPIGFFAREDTAVAYAKSKEPYSADYYPQFCRVEQKLLMHETPEEMETIARNEEIEKARSKLTAKELELLGLSDE